MGGTAWPAVQKALAVKLQIAGISHEECIVALERFGPARTIGSLRSKMAEIKKEGNIGSTWEESKVKAYFTTLGITSEIEEQLDEVINAL